MQATDILIKEHNAIKCVLDSLDKASEAIKAGKQVRPGIFEDGLDFIRNFADKCHHGKEEDRLFVLLGTRGIPTEGGPIGMMLIEHEHGRAYVREAAEAYKRWTAGDTSAAMQMADALQNYINLLREHIFKEDNILYPMGDRLITAEDDAQLVKEFDEFEEQEMGPGVHERYHAMIDRLEEETAGL